MQKVAARDERPILDLGGRTRPMKQQGSSRRSSKRWSTAAREGTGELEGGATKQARAEVVAAAQGAGVAGVESKLEKQKRFSAGGGVSVSVDVGVVAGNTSCRLVRLL